VGELRAVAITPTPDIRTALFHTLLSAFENARDRHSVVGIATGYGLDGPGIESRWGRDFPHLSTPALWPKRPPIK